MPERVVVSLTQSCIESLMAVGVEQEDPGRRLVTAVAYFLTEKGSGEAGFPYPDFRREEADEAGQVLELVIAVDLWRRFTEEAERQRISPDRFLEHAALFFAAEVDAGKLAARLGENLRE